MEHCGLSALWWRYWYIGVLIDWVYCDGSACTVMEDYMERTVLWCRIWWKSVLWWGSDETECAVMEDFDGTECTVVEDLMEQCTVMEDLMELRVYCNAESDGALSVLWRRTGCTMMLLRFGVCFENTVTVSGICFENIALSRFGIRFKNAVLLRLRIRFDNTVTLGTRFGNTLLPCFGLRFEHTVSLSLGIRFVNSALLGIRFENTVLLCFGTRFENTVALFWNVLKHRVIVYNWVQMLSNTREEMVIKIRRRNNAHSRTAKTWKSTQNSKDMKVNREQQRHESQHSRTAKTWKSTQQNSKDMKVNTEQQRHESQHRTAKTWKSTQQNSKDMKVNTAEQQRHESQHRTAKTWKSTQNRSVQHRSLLNAEQLQFLF